MKAQSSYPLIYIGLEVRLLRNLRPTQTVDFARRNIEKLEKRLDDTGFFVSKAGMNAMRQILRDLRKLDGKDELGANAGKITVEMKLVEKLVFSEAQTREVYTVPERRYNSDYLLRSPARLFKDGNFEKLSDIAQFDVASACRCVLFGEGTAAAFHILRGSEEVLKMYYRHHVRRNRLKKPMWGPMVTALRAKQKNKPPASLLDSLDLVRTSYRNPTQHPEARYDIEEAQDLFGVCVDLISRMANELSGT